MIIYTDDITYAGQLVPDASHWRSINPGDVAETLRPLVTELFPEVDISYTEVSNNGPWQNLFVTKHAERSQYDVFSGLCERGIPLPDHTLCMADSGRKFHGFKNRSWVSLPGNIHLVAYLEPRQELAHVGVGFIVMAVAAVLQALDGVEGLSGRAAVKWVNDIMIDDAKVCGVLANSQMQGTRVDGAIIGIGLNVESAPEVVPDLFVSRAACLRDFVTAAASCHVGEVFRMLNVALDKMYRCYCDGGYGELIRMYRDRSAIISKTVSIRVDKVGVAPDEIISGRVQKIGDNLELYLENHPEPISTGRLIIKN